MSDLAQRLVDLSVNYAVQEGGFTGDGAILAEAAAEIDRLIAIERDLVAALAFVKSEREHWRKLVPNAERVKHPFRGC